MCLALLLCVGIVPGRPDAAAATSVVDVHLPTPSSQPPAPAHPPLGPDGARWVGTSSGGDDDNRAPHSSGATAAPEDTLNWAGEVSSGSGFTSVVGDWTVPATLASVTPRDSAAWIGIGGGSPMSPGLIQTGTDQATRDGRTTYSAWYEILPAPAVTVVDPTTGQPLPVAPGNRMEAQIAEVREGVWRLEIRDVTEGWVATGTFVYHGTTATAEWIVEAPTLRTRIETLADFQTVHFSDMQTTSSGLVATSLQPIDMVNSHGSVIAYPGTVTSTTTREVSVYYGAPGANVPTPAPTPSSEPGYDLATADGGVFVFDPPGRGGGYYGSLPGSHIVPNKPIVGIVATSDHQGYYLVGADGSVFAFGDARYLGSLPAINVVPRQPVVGMAAAATDRGYFLVGADGGVFAFGAVRYLGALPGDGISVDDIVGIATTLSGNGYWLVASNGKVYAFGAAQRFGTVNATASPVTSITATPTGGGYWTVTANGSVEAFGNAKSYGTLPRAGVTPNRPIVAIVPTQGDGGYWLIGADGGVFAFGDAEFLGSLPRIANMNDVVGAVATGG